MQTNFGSQPNQVEIPPLKFIAKDLKVRLADGQVAGQEFPCSVSNPLVELAK